MEDLVGRLATFWTGLAAHLWQSGLFLAALALLALALRRASARTLCVLYWVGILKLLLPLPLLGPFFGELLPSLAGAPVAGSTVAVWMAPTLVVPDPARSPAVLPVLLIGITAVWLAGAALIFIRRMGARAGLRRMAAPRERLPSALLPTLRAVGLDAADVRVCLACPVPFVRGGWRPTIVLPRTVVDEFDAEELRAVLIHEREHLRRRDPLRYGMLAVVRTLFWFFPPVWWLARRIRETTEMACDEAVVRAGMPPQTYCRCLARSLSLGLARHPAASVVGILGHRVSYLRRRLERIRSGRRFEAMSLHRMTVATAAIAAVALSLLPVAPTPSLLAHAGSAEAHELEALAEPDLPVVLHFQQGPIEKVFQALQGASGVRFLVSKELAGKTVDIDTGRVSLKDALLELGHAAKLSYEVLDPHHVQVVPLLTADSDGVTPPVLLPESKIAPVYPELMRLGKVQGRVILQAKIDASGNVGAIEVLNSQPEDEEASRLFIESARDAVSGWRYEPATKDDEPVEVWFTIRIDFELQ